MTLRRAWRCSCVTAWSARAACNSAGLRPARHCPLRNAWAGAEVPAPVTDQIRDQPFASHRIIRAFAVALLVAVWRRDRGRRQGGETAAERSENDIRCSFFWQRHSLHDDRGRHPRHRHHRVAGHLGLRQRDRDTAWGSASSASRTAIDALVSCALANLSRCSNSTRNPVPGAQTLQRRHRAGRAWVRDRW
jgi:hypothetical protein